MPGTTPRRPATTRVTAEQVAAEASPREPFVFDNPEEEARFDAAIAQADAELAARPVVVNFRWEKAPLDLVRQAADLSGVGYQAWVKQALYKAALAEIRAAAGIDVRADARIHRDAGDAVRAVLAAIKAAGTPAPEQAIIEAILEGTHVPPGRPAKA